MAESSNWNLTIIALVALVSIVSVVALVMNGSGTIRKQSQTTSGVSTNMAGLSTADDICNDCIATCEETQCHRSPKAYCVDKGQCITTSPGRGEAGSEGNKPTPGKRVQEGADLNFGTMTGGGTPIYSSCKQVGMCSYSADCAGRKQENGKPMACFTGQLIEIKVKSGTIKCGTCM